MKTKLSEKLHIEILTDAVSPVQADVWCTFERKETRIVRMERTEEVVGTAMRQQSTSKSEGKNSSNCSLT